MKKEAYRNAHRRLDGLVEMKIGVEKYEKKDYLYFEPSFIFIL